MGFSMVYLVNFYLLGKKVTHKIPKYSWIEKVVNRRLYNRKVSYLEAVNPEPLFGSRPNLGRLCLTTRENFPAPKMSKKL